jgi:hypothetical protein
MKPLVLLHSLLNTLRAKALQWVWRWSQGRSALRAPALVPIRLHSTQREHPRSRYRYRD